MQLLRLKGDHTDEFRQGLAPAFALAVGQHTVPTPASAGAGGGQLVALRVDMGPAPPPNTQEAKEKRGALREGRDSFVWRSSMAGLRARA